MQGAQGHSRKESDDFKLSFGDDTSANFEVDGVDILMDPALELSLSFQQPKASFTFHSFCAFFAIRIEVSQLKLIPRGIWKCYVHPAGAVLAILAAILVPLLLGWSVVHSDYKERGEWLVIDKSLTSFQIPGHISSQREDMVTVASKHSSESKGETRIFRRKRSAENPDIFPTTRPPPHYQKYPKWKLELVYLATGDDSDLNIFTKERVETIHQIEQNIMKQDHFADFCWKWPQATKDPFLPNGCTPPISLINFLYPSVTADFRLNDGQGKGFGGKRNLTQESINRSLEQLLSKSFTYWFVDSSFSKGNLKSRFLRAEVKFGYPLKWWKYGHSRHAQYKSFHAYLVKFVEALRKMSTDKVRVLYGGNEIFDYEVDRTLWGDIRLSVFTIVFVKAFLFVFTRFSLFLTFFGVTSILTPICIAYWWFRVVFGVKSLGILSGISLFIIIGIGVDDVFVFINTFRQAHNAKSLEARMAHTLLTAGKATFFTSFTTSAAFAANCLSTMPAIHDFGLFMALIVSCCWVTVFCTIPPVLNLWYRYISKWEEVMFQRLCGWTSCLFGSGQSTLPDDIVQFLSGNDRNSNHNQSASTSLEEMELSSRTPIQDDDDSSLLQLNNSPPNSQSPSPSSSDSDLAMYDDPNSTFDLQMAPLMRRTTSQPRSRVTQQNQCDKGCICWGGLQGFLYHWLAVPIKEFPFIFLGMFLLILTGSIALDTQIRASTKPPAFFKEDTNLQQLLYLKYNMSSDSLNINNLAWDLIGSVKQTNNVDNPTTKPRTTHTESNGIKSSTPAPSPVTADQTGGQPNGNVQHYSVKTKSSTSRSRPTSHPVMTSTPSPATTQKSTLSSSSKSSPKSTKKPTTQHKQETGPRTQKTGPLVAKKPKTGDSGNVDGPTSSSAVKTVPPLCPEGTCTPIPKPISDTSATVYVILGLKAIDRSMITREHVLEEKGVVVPDFDFTDLLVKHPRTFLNYACRLCKKLSENSQLVQPGGADCFPSWIIDRFHQQKKQNPHDPFNNKACLEITSPSFLPGKQSRAKLMKMPSKDRKHGNYTYWMKMAFESSVFKGKSSQERVKDFDNWNNFLKEEVKSYPKGFQTAFQTSEEWVYTFTEVIAVNSAIYGIAFSLLLCLGLVAIFTANVLLTLIVMITILGVLSTVVAIFYVASWQLGAVEAISLSILVGTSVDYCVHLVEGYIMAGNAIPNLSTSKEIRGWRTLAAVSHIGTAILSSAITTIVASIPLCLTTILLFAKFGQILAINTAVSIFFTLTICVALLCLMSPVRFRASIKSSLIAFAVVVCVYLVGAAILFLINWKAMVIPGPAGEPLFPIP